MRGERNSDRKTRKFITIADTNLWEQIERIMTLPTYEKSFNKVINSALVYGLPKLCAVEFGETEEVNVIDTATREADNKDNDEIFLTIVRLLREVIINENINKSLICSLFRLREIELGNSAVGKQFSNGHFQDTPDCLAKYEITELKKLRD